MPIRHNTYPFPKSKYKALRTTNGIDGLHEEFRWRVKTKIHCQIYGRGASSAWPPCLQADLDATDIDRWHGTPRVTPLRPVQAAPPKTVLGTEYPVIRPLKSL